MLEFDKLIRKARARSGYSDPGSDFDDEPLRVLLRSINEEANLSPFGKFLIKEKIIGQLESRLRAEYHFKKYPEILRQEVLPVYMITGLQRTGTTRMQRILSSQPGAKGLMSWEALYPAPIGRPDEQKIRIRKTRLNARAVRIISPGFFNIHPIIPDGPEEDVLLLDVNFMSTSMEALAHVPSYSSWLEAADHSSTYAYEAKLLKLLQWQKNGDFWVLKSPHHLEYLPVLHEKIPEITLIWTHRDLDKVIPSFLSMLYHSRCMFSEDADLEKIKEHWLNKMKRMTEKGIEALENGNYSVNHVRFEDFMRNENEIIAKILKCNTDDINKMANNYKSRHNYSSEYFQIGEQEISSRFRRYLEFQREIDYIKP